ncbi:integumentary mucin C.1-like, partial [Folsomia candida]|uniref:integumentary mucin C.1-like n=1 Tax=Folsomia candida TaxID=158441 RepID=UPI001605512F
MKMGDLRRTLHLVAIVFYFCSTWVQVLACDVNNGEPPQAVYCPQWEGGIPTYHPFAYDCRKFIQCTNGYPVVHCCAPGTVWDQGLHTCNHAANSPCVIVTTTPTPSPTLITSEETETLSTTTTPTTTTPTTTTPTTTTPTTTTPTTTTPTTTTPTTTTPTTTTPTTTTPTTTTPTTTTPTTTTP